VRTTLVAIVLQVLSGANVVGGKQVIPDIATSRMSEDGRNRQWIVNSHIELATLYDVYKWCREKCILRTGRRNAMSDFRNIRHCIGIPMQAGAQWINSDVGSHSATTPDCEFQFGDQYSEKPW
jgi:hypothetical protein